MPNFKDEKNENKYAVEQAIIILGTSLIRDF